MPEYAVEVIDSIRRVASSEWDQIAAECIGANRALLGCYEDANPDWRIRYLLLREQGQLQAAAIVVASEGDNRLGRELFGRGVEHMRFAEGLFQPALICGVVRGPGAPVLIRPGLNEALWTRRVVEALEARAAQEEKSLAWHATTDQRVLLDTLRQRGYGEGAGLPVARACVTWRDEAGYLAALRKAGKSRYATARNEMNRFRRGGLRIVPWDGCGEQSAFRLLAAHHQDRNDTAFDMPASFLSRLKDAMGDDCLISLALRGEALVGAVVVLRRGKRAWLWKIGVDHERDRGSFAYFNLAYYHPFRSAPALGIESIYCGNGVLDAKLRRGCRGEATHVFFRPRAALARPLISAALVGQRHWYQRKFAPWVAGEGIPPGAAVRHAAGDRQ